MTKQPAETRIPDHMALPAKLADINANFLSQLLKARGLLEVDNEITAVEEAGVGMTAGYFSDIKKIHCHFQSPTSCPAHFVAKAWPDFEMMPGEAISDMFIKDIKGYMIPSEQFYPRPISTLLTLTKQTTDGASSWRMSISLLSKKFMKPN